MSDDVYRVAGRSWDQIEAIADTYRSALGVTRLPRLPIIELMEEVLDQRLELFHLQVGDHREMENAEGLTCPKGSFIRLREDVYVDGLKGQGRARFTAAHELGHFALHTNLPLARVAPGQRVKQYENSEAQANHFAACLLMPSSFFDHHDDLDMICRRHGVSRSAAKNRYNFLYRRGTI